MKTCLVTGCCGFIASHLVNYLLKNTDWEIIGWDNFTYAAEGGKRLVAIGALDDPRFHFYKVDIATNQFAFECKPEIIVHLAAETHVDRSIQDAEPFIKTNIYGTWRLLEFARSIPQLEKFLYFSSDEVFGPANGEPFSEWARYNSSNPYSATKAAGEEISLACANTFGIPVIISHCANVFGEMQNEEKFIPKLVRQISNGETVTIHSRPDGTSGSRMYVYAGDVAKAIHLILEQGEVRAKYNIPGREITNLEMAIMVQNIMDKDLQILEDYPYSTRPGWDFSYRISGELLKELGWKPTLDFEGLLRKVVMSYA